jgi:hypothetical protein
VEAADAVSECTGTTPADTKCQWIVRPNAKWEKSVRLDNIGFEELYLREWVKPDGVVVYQPGLGLPWGDMYSTTINFLNPSIPNASNYVFVLGAEVASMKLAKGPGGGIKLDSHTPYLLGTTKEGTLVSAEKVTADLSSSWKVQIIGHLDSNNKPVITVPEAMPSQTDTTSGGESGTGGTGGTSVASGTGGTGGTSATGTSGTSGTSSTSGTSGSTAQSST